MKGLSRRDGIVREKLGTLVMAGTHTDIVLLIYTIKKVEKMDEACNSRQDPNR